MSTQTEITRLIEARNTIRDKMVEFGLGTSTSKLDALATAIDGITNQGAVDASVKEGESYTIPKGYHSGSGTVKGVTGGGNYSLQAKSATPTKNQQSITPDAGYYGLSGVTVGAIPEAYQNVSAVTAGAADVLTGKVIVDKTGSSVAGTMPNIGKVTKVLDATEDNQSYTVPKGYHAGTGTVSIALETKSVTPTKAAQTVTPTAGKVLSSVAVTAIPNNFADVTGADDLTDMAEKIPEGVVVYGKDADGNAQQVTGEMDIISGTTTTLTTTSTSHTIPKGYHDGTGKVQIALETKTATPSTAVQNITPSTGKVLSKVTVNAIPATFGNTSDATVTAADVKAGVIAYGKDADGNATKITGAMPINSTKSASIDGLNTTSYAVTAGYTAGFIVSLTDDIETALAAI